MKSLIKGASAGVLFWSSFFWTCVFSWVTPVDGSEILIPIVTNAVIGLLLADKSYKQVTINIAISIPFGVITFLYYKLSNYLHRLFNIVSPDCDNMTANEGITVIGVLIIFLLCYSIALAIAFSIATYKINKSKTI